jgi:hypothetical protein
VAAEPWLPSPIDDVPGVLPLDSVDDVDSVSTLSSEAQANNRTLELMMKLAASTFMTSAYSRFRAGLA